jgi:hypothetical protein
MRRNTHGVRRDRHIDIVLILHGLIAVLLLLVRGRSLNHAIILSRLL